MIYTDKTITNYQAQESLEETNRKKDDLLPRYTDETCQSLRTQLKDKKIAVFVTAMNGLGDYLCAAKICKYLHNSLGIDDDHLALVVSRMDDIAKKVLQDSGIKNILDQEYSLFKQTWNPDIQIFSPVCDSFFVNPRTWGDVPSLAIAEYGFPEPNHLNNQKNNSIHPYAFGLTDSSMGIILDEDLVKWSKSDDSLDPMKRLQKLESVPISLQYAILGEAYSEKAIENFANHSKFYFGYAHHRSEMFTFIECLATMSDILEDKSDICIYFMGKNFHVSEKSDHSLITYLNLFGIGKLQIIKTDYNTVESIIINKDVSKTIKVITGLIPSAYVPFLHMASEDVELATGDQTLSQDISAGKYPIYETYPHKKILQKQFFDALPKKIQEIADFYDHSKKEHDLEFMLDRDKLSHFFILTKKDKKLAKEVKDAISNIADKFSFANRFNIALSKLLNETTHLKKFQPTFLCLPPLSELSSKDIPFNTPFLISLYDVEKLSLKYDGISKLDQFKDSIFEYNVGHHLDKYLIIRKSNLLA